MRRFLVFAALTFAAISASAQSRPTDPSTE
jgi:hypothetical protein